MHPKIPLLLNRIRRDWQDVGPGIKRTLLATLIGLLPVVLTAKGVAERVEPILLESWFDLRGQRATPATVSIVRIDKAAYDVVGLSLGEMFPRDSLAKAIDVIAANGAKLIVLDGVLQRPGPSPEIDRKLANSLRRAPVVIGRYNETLIETGPSGEQVHQRYSVKPIPLFQDSADAVISLEVRPSGAKIREIALSNAQHVYSEVNVPLLPPIRAHVSSEVTEPGGRDFINFYGGASTISSLSLARLIKPGAEIDSAYFKDRVVFIGIASEARTGIAAGKDTFATSISDTPMYGVEIHATIAANLLDGSWIRRLPLLVEGLAMGTLALILSFAILTSGPLLGLAIAALWCLISYIVFIRLNYFLPGATVFLVVVAFAVLFVWGLPAFVQWVQRKSRSGSGDFVDGNPFPGQTY